MKSESGAPAGKLRALRVLVISPRQCWPTRSGAKLRDYHLARALGETAQLTYLYYSDPGAAPLTAAELPFARSIVSVPRPRGYSLPKLIEGLVSKWPLSVVNYYSRPMALALEKLLQEPFDLVQFDATHLAGFVPLVRKHCPRAQIVFDWHNIESELLQRYAESTRSPFRRLYAKLTARKMAALESSLLRSDAWHLVCSEREQWQLQAQSPQFRIAVIGNGVDAQYYAPSAAATTAPRHRLLFVGLMSYHANIEAAVWFVQKLWLAIRDKYPQLTLTIAGADPSPAVLHLNQIPGVEVTGTVPDLRPYYQEAFAVIVPLLTGAGTRLKILEAMASGVPIISTALGAEGLSICPGENILIAHSPDDWLQHLDQLAIPERWASLVLRAHGLIRAKYGWQLIGNLLCDTYAQWFEGAFTSTPSSVLPPALRP